MRIGITGASGYVGSKVYEYVERTAHDPVRFGRHPDHHPHQEYVYYELGHRPDPADLKDVDAVIHLAYDFSPTSMEEIWETNVEGSLGLFDAAIKTDTRLIEVSTLSAFEGCRSKYGRAKLALERESQDRGFPTIRPGLVYGAEKGSVMGGLYGLAKRSPVIPVPAGGPYLHYTCHYADLGELLVECCAYPERTPAEPIVAAHEEGVEFSRIVRELAASSGSSVRLLPVPPTLMFYGLWAFEMVGLPIGLRSDSVTGLVHPNPSPNFSSRREMQTTFRPFDQQSLSADIGDTDRR